MSRCAKFHHLFDEVGNFCGMSAASISYYRAYREQVKKIARAGRLEEDFIFGHFTEAPSRLIAKMDAEARTKALNYVTGRLAEGRQITTGDLRAAMKTWQGKGGPQEPRNLTIVKTSTTPPLPVETGAPAGSKPDTGLPPCPPGTGQQRARGCPAAARIAAGTPADRDGDARLPGPGSTRAVPARMAREEAEKMVSSVVRQWLLPPARAAWERLRESGQFGDSDLQVLEGLLENAAGRPA